MKPKNPENPVHPVKTSTHTPGPWKVEYGIQRQDNRNHHVMAQAADDGRRVEVCRVYPISDDGQPMAESYFNAHLIAAAPDLLAALEWILAYYTAPASARFSEPRDVHAAARAAIAKAKGEA